jgi:hypothetical protein
LDRYQKDERYDKYRGREEDYKRSYERRKEYAREDEAVRKDSKEYQQVYQSRTSGNSFEKTRPADGYSRPEER